LLSGCGVDSANETGGELTAIEKYAEESEKIITLDMQDGQGDQANQNDQLDELIEKGVDVLCINAVDIDSARGLADKAKAAGIPAVFFNGEPVICDWQADKSQSLMETILAVQEQQMSRGEMIFSQKRREYWLLSCSLGEVAGCRGCVAPCKAYAYRHSSEAGFAVK